MKRIIVILLSGALCLIPRHGAAQGRVEYETVGKSRLTDFWGNGYGAGDMQKISLSYSVAVSRHWQAGAYADYIMMENHGKAAVINDSRIVNAGISCGYMHPLSAKWSMLATLGAGVFAPSDEVSLKSVLGSCGAVFICRINDNLDLGGGIGISNAYGIPMVMPMLYLNWHRDGRLSFNIDMANGINVGASMQLGSKFKIDLTAINMSGISAVRDCGGRSKIYSQLCVHSSLSPVWLISPTTSLFVGVGGSWARSVSESDRTIKAFFSGFSEEHRSKDFGMALRLNAGMRWKF